MPEFIHVLYGYGLYPYYSLFLIKSNQSFDFMDLLNLLVQIGILCTAIYGIKLIILTKRQSAVTELKDFAELLANFDSLSVKHNLTSYKGVPMDEFTETELGKLGSNQIQVLKDYYKFCFDPENSEFYSQVSKMINRLEVLSLVLVKEIGEIDTVKETMAFPFCFFVEVNTILYVKERNERYKLYQNTIKLYQILKPVYGNQDHIVESYDEYWDRIEKLIENDRNNKKNTRN